MGLRTALHKGARHKASAWGLCTLMFSTNLESCGFSSLSHVEAPRGLGLFRYFGATGGVEGDPVAGPLKGAALLGLLQAAVRCGVPVVQSCMQRLLWHCNQVLFKQLTSWCVSGWPEW